MEPELGAARCQCTTVTAAAKVPRHRRRHWNPEAALAWAGSGRWQVQIGGCVTILPATPIGPLAGDCGRFVIRPKSVTRPSLAATAAPVCSPDAARRDSGLCCRCRLMLTASAAALARKTTP